MVLRTNLDRKISQFVEKTEANLDNTVREVMAEAGFLAVVLSPVFTGRFRASWRISQDSVDTTTSVGAINRNAARRLRATGSSYAPSLGGDFGKLREQALEMKAGKTHYLTNSVEYADKVNDGDSSTGRKPALIVEQIRLLFPTIVAKAATRVAG